MARHRTGLGRDLMLGVGFTHRGHLFSSHALCGNVGMMRRTNNVGGSVDRVLPNPPTPFDVTVVLSIQRPDSTDDDYFPDVGAEARPKVVPLASSRRNVGPGEIQDPVPDAAHRVVLMVMCQLKHEQPRSCGTREATLGPIVASARYDSGSAYVPLCAVWPAVHLLSIRGAE